VIASPESFSRLTELPPLQAARRVSNGRPCHLVGGALRDSYLGLAAADLDLVVAGDGDAFSRNLANQLAARLVALGGDRFASYRLVGRRFTLDVWGRGETTLRSDLERRDFTINALALDLHTASLEDPFDGLADMRDRTLRAVTAAGIAADPCRVLRLVRLALLLPSFSIDSGTFDLAAESASRLSEVAAERLRSELGRILGDGQPTQALDLLIRLSVLGALWTASWWTDRNGESLHQWLARYEKIEVKCVEIAGRRPNRLLSVHALIARAVGEGSGTAVSDIVGRLRRRGLMTKAQSRRVAPLAVAPVALFDESPRRFLARWGEGWVDAAAVLASHSLETADARIDEHLTSLARTLEHEGQRVLSPRPLLDGRVVSDLLDIDSGPLLGRILALLLDAQLAGRITDREEAVRLLPELLEAARREADED